MLYWLESEDKNGMPTWQRYVGCSQWGMFLTVELPRWLYPPTPYDWHQPS